MLSLWGKSSLTWWGVWVHGSSLLGSLSGCSPRQSWMHDMNPSEGSSKGQLRNMPLNQGMRF